MKNKIRKMLMALVLCMGAFFMPVTAYAEEAADETPPVLGASLSGTTLHIEASDKETGVDAVFINGKRVNYRVDSALDLDFLKYADGEKSVEVYAIDFAGNRSKVVEIYNPYFEAGEETGSALAGTDPEAAARPLTPDGQATLLDSATDGDGKEFYTITTAEENVFYLVIDRQRESGNVYFLNAVTEEDLKALAVKDTKKEELQEEAVPEPEVCTCREKCRAGEVDLSCPVCKNTMKSCLGIETEQEPVQEKPKGGSAGTVFFVLLAAAAAGGAGYYLKIYKPKHDLDDAEDLDELLYDEEPEVNEDEDTAENTGGGTGEYGGEDAGRKKEEQGEDPGGEMPDASFDDYPYDDFPDEEE